MKNSTLFSIIETRFKDRFYCCLESLKGNYKFLLVFLMFMGSFMQGVSAQGTLVPSCNLIGPLEACAVADPSDTSGDIIVNVEVARSGVPNLSGPNNNLNFVYTFPSNSAGAFIRSYGPVVYNAITNRTTQTLVVFPGSSTPEFNLQLNATNTTSSPSTVCECSKSVSVSKVAVTSSYAPIACFGQTTTLTAVGQFSDIGQYTYTLLPSGPSNNDGIFAGLAGSEAGITYTIVCESAEGCIATTSQTITQPAYNPVVLTCPQPLTTAPCLTQDAVNAAFNAWLATFSYTGGTAPVITRTPSEPNAPSACGGSVTVTWSATDRCAAEPVTCSSTFTVPTPPGVVVNGPESSTTNACIYENQAAADAAFATWLSQFTATGGCAPSGSYGQPVAPPYCGGTVEVTYNVTDRCYQGSSITRTFTITPAPQVNVSGPADSTTNACIYEDQAAADAAFAAWLSGFSVTGGCAPSGSYGEPVAPPYCGGTVTVNYNVTDRCYQGSTLTRVFTITPAPQVNVSGPENSTTNACTYADQAAADAAFASWLAQFSATGGCAPSGSYGQPVAPPYCGGTVTVNYTVTDKCYEGSTLTRVFTITPAPQVNVTQAQSSTTSACIYENQAAADAAFASWLSGFSVSGGCAPQGSFGEGTPTAPEYCGGSRTVTYTVRDKCYETASFQATFTITPAPQINISGPESSTTNACIYADQAAADAAFAAWLSQFSVTGGCSPSGSYGQPVAPPYCGGTVEVTYNVTDKCYQGSSITRTFTITPAPGVEISGPANDTTNACIYADQAAADAAFAAWLSQFSVSGGCSPSGSYGQPVAPPYCGGMVEVTFRVSDRCYEGSSITRIFTITPAPAVTFTAPSNSTVPAGAYADQAAADAAFAAWLAQFSVSGGCSPSGSYGQPVAPPYCGGTVTVNYTITDKCYEGLTITRTFEITPGNPPVINAPESASSNACIYADQAAADAAYAAWLSQFSVSGGINPSGSFGEGGAPAAPQYCGGTVEVTYTVTDACWMPTIITRTFTITPAPPVNVDSPENSTTSACIYADQAAADAAFAAWLAEFSVDGGCAPSGVLSVLGSSPTAPINAPAYCGGTVTVSYSVIDKCYQGAFIVRTFTITAPPAVNVTEPTDSTTSACIYANQAEADAAFAAWLTGFTVSGGCAPTGSFGEGAPTAPPYCGGTTTVNFTVRDKCYETTSYSAVFTITAPPAVTFTTPEDSTTSACSYANQAEADAAFATWLAGFTVSGGCAPSGSYGQPVAPPYCGGTVTVNYSITDRCYEGSRHSATFTITAPPAVNVTTAQNSTSSACAYADQAAVNAAFAAWLSQFSVSGGCAPQGSFGEGTPNAPELCGGTRTVIYTVTDRCYETTTHTATFTITAPVPVVINANDVAYTSCDFADQAALNAAFTAWLNTFTVSGGCTPSGTIVGQPQPPVLCIGGSVCVTFNVTDKCYTGTVTKKFSLTSGEPVDVSGPANSTTSSCAYADQAAADAAFAAWLAQFQTVNDGCGATATFSPSEFQAPRICTGGTVTLIYSIHDNCSQDSVTASFTITPTPEVVFNCGQNVTIPACSTQAQVNTAWTVFLASASASGGCGNGTLTNNAPANAPSACGGSVDVTWTYNVTGCGTSQSCTRTFTVTPAPQVVFNCGNDVTVPACSTQAQVDAAWTAFLNSTTASGGCNGNLTRTSAAKPSLCGGSASITWTYTVGSCGETQSCTRTFTVAAPAPVVINCGSNVTLPACSTQAELNAAWTAFLNSTTASGGCGGVLTRTQCSPPSLCGGYVDVTWKYTVASCGPQSGCGDNSYVTCTRRFTVAAPAQVAMHCGTNVTVPACSTQAQVDAAWAAFLASTTASGGCGGVLTNNGTTPPSICGGYKDVTWTYRVASCGQQSGCGSSNTVTCTKRFTIAAPSQVVFNCGTNVTLSGCKTQAQVNAAYAAFLASTTASGGCGGVLTNNAPANAPSACTGGYIDVTWTYTVASCGQQSGCGNTNSLTCTKRFTVPASAPIVFNCGTDVTVPACSTQSQVTAAWNSFLASTTASGGCNGSLTRTQCVAPPVCGGSVDVTWTYTASSCDGPVTRTCTRTFTVAAPPQVVFNCGTNVTVPACSTQAQITAAWNSFLASTTASGGCNGNLTRTNPTPPSTCGGSVNVTWTYTVSTCGQQSGCGNNTNSVSCTKTFTVAAPPAATLTCASNVTVPACSTQAQIDAAYAAFLASATVSGGCSTGTLTHNGPTVAPGICGGYVDVTWTYRTNNNCQQVSCGGSYGSNGTVTCTKRFTVAAPPAATLTCASNVTVPACSTQAQVDAAYAAFLASATVSGGCSGGTLTHNGSTVAPPACGGYTDVTWTYRTNNNCQQVSCGGSYGSNGTVTCTKRFTVASPSVTINVSNNVTVPACSTQAQVTAAWNTFVNSGSLSGACAGATLTNNAPTVAPSTCGGYVDVTWTYRSNTYCTQIVTCGGQSSQGSTYTVTRRFTVAAPSGATINAGNNVTLASCKTQAQVNAAWTSFLASTTFSGGCSGGTLTNNAPSVAPSACGGYVDVTWTYRSNNQCGQTITCGGQTTTASTYTVTRRFTVTAAPAVNVSGPSSVSYVNTHFSSQYAVNNAFAAWLCQFTTINSGCGATAVFSGSPRVAPSWTSGGTVSVTYSISNGCTSDSVCATFTITRGGSNCKTEIADVKEAMVVKAYPNPFSENFNLDLTSPSVDKVGVAIYDMTGKLIEQREVNADEVSGLQVGDRYASGVYNVIVTQGTEVKTLRVIKR